MTRRQVRTLLTLAAVATIAFLGAYLCVHLLSTGTAVYGP